MEEKNDNYLAQGHFGFGSVISALKQGKKVCRNGWNGKGMYLWLLPESDVKREWIKDPLLLEAFGDKDVLRCGYCIRMKNAQGNVDTWHPSIPDIFAEDWCILDLFTIKCYCFRYQITITKQ